MPYRFLGNLVEPANRQRDDAEWSVAVLAACGVGVRAHFTFLLLLAWLGYHSLQGPDPLPGFLFLMGVVASFAMHELAHAAVAFSRGLRPRDVVLYPLGGVPNFDRRPAPLDEVLVASAGPLASAVLGGVLLWTCELTGPVLSFDKLLGVQGHWLEKLMLLNVTLALLNLYPGFPGDGGRMLRGGLTPRIGHTRASVTAGVLGYAGGMLAGLYAALGHPYLLFFTIFMILGAGAELGLSHHSELVEGVSVEEAMITHFASLSPADTLGRACEVLLRGSQQDFPVIHDGRLIGMLTREDLIRGLGREGRLGYVAAAMRRDYPSASPSMDLTDLIELFEEHGASSLPVLDGEHVIGLITPENVGEYLAVKRHSPRA